MDMFACELSFPFVYGPLPTSGPLVSDKIASEGGEFSRHFTMTERIDPRLRCENFSRELDELNLFPEQFEREFPQPFIRTKWNFQPASY